LRNKRNEPQYPKRADEKGKPTLMIGEGEKGLAGKKKGGLLLEGLPMGLGPKNLARKISEKKRQDRVPEMP